MASLHEDCVDAVVALLGAATITGTPAVFKAATPDVSAQAYPALRVALDLSADALGPLDSENNERTATVRVDFLDRRPQDSGAKFWDWLQAREDVEAVFVDADYLLDDVPECWHVDLRPLPAPDPKRTAGPALQEARGGLAVVARLTTERVREG